MTKPNLRFPNFTNNWQMVKLGDICHIVSGGTPSTQKEEYWGGDIQWITPTEITSLNSVYITNPTTRTITTLGLKNSSAVLIPANSIILCSRATIGNCAINTYEIATNQGFKNLVTKSNCYYLFLYYFIVHIKKELLQISSGTTFLEFSKSDLLKIKIYLPPLKEQKKIGDFLLLIDRQISILKQQKTKLEDYKKTLSTKIFNQTLKFKGFTKEWQTVKLGDICQYANGKSFEKNIIVNGHYSLITLNSINIDGNLKLSHKTINETDHSLIKNDIVMILSDIAHGNFLGLSDLIPCNDKYVLNQRIGRLRLNKNINPIYIRKYINVNQNYFKLHGQGTSQLNLSKSDILKFHISLPPIKEQQKISNILSNIDKLITNKQAHLTKTLQYKTYLLQNIFVY